MRLRDSDSITCLVFHKRRKTMFLPAHIGPDIEQDHDIGPKGVHVLRSPVLGPCKPEADRSAFAMQSCTRRHKPRASAVDL